MSTSVRKITSLIERSELTYSLEVTPNVSREEIDNLGSKPIFYSITWHAKVHQCKDMDISPLQLARYLRSKGITVLLHLSCDMLRSDFLNNLLEMLQDNGICNLLVVLGEKYESNSSDFQSSKDLIQYIRRRTGDYFCIGVAGFPDHSDKKILQLKEKIDSGADFVITQAFFDIQRFKTFVQNCRSVGISVPIIPGVYLYETLQQLINFTNICKVKVSADLLEYVEKKMQEGSGDQIVKTLIEDISNADIGSKNIHFFTLDKVQLVTEFVKKLELFKRYPRNDV